MNVVTLDRRAAQRLVSLTQGRPRPRVLRRVVTLPGMARSRRARLEPTALHPGRPRAPIQIESGDTPSPGVVRTLVWYYLRMIWLRLTRRYSDAHAGYEMRIVLERLGGFWMKVGQLMSLRRDVLPPAFCDELTKLQSQAIGFPPEQAMAVVERALGQPLDRVFAAFEPMPFAAASISQVHKARLRHPPVDVVVKVQRPGIKEKFARDLRILEFIARQLSRFTRLRRLNLRDAMVEFRQILLEETDYRYEISNMRELRRTTRGHGIIIPRVFSELSGEDIIVMEWVPGVLMSDFNAARTHHPAVAERWMEENDIDPERVGRKLLVSFMRQLFENNLFHADLHPGNIILLRANRIALIDMGSVGSLDREFLILYRGIQRALATADFGKAADLQLRLCAKLPPRSVTELRTELIHCLKRWSARTKVKGLPFRERSVNTGAAEVSEILSRYGAQQSWEFLKIARTLSTLDASLESLYSGLDYISILKKYFDRAAGRATRKAASLRSLRNSFASALASVDEYHLMLAPVLRRDAFNFEATLSKASRVFALLVRLLLGVGTLGLISLVYKYIREHHAARIMWVRNEVLDDVSSEVPHLDRAWWWVALVALLVVLVLMRRILFELLRPDSNGRRRG